MKDGRYRYRYLNLKGEQKAIYSWKLVVTDRSPNAKKGAKALRDLEAEIERDLQQRLNLDLSSLKLIDYVERYLNTKGGLKKSSLELYQYMVQLYLANSELAQREIKAIKKADILNYYKTLNAEYAKSTIETLNHIIYPTFELAIDEEAILKNPCKNCMKELGNREKKGVIAFTLEEQEYFLNWLQQHNEKLYILYSVFLGTGCRVGEILGLTWNDIDMNEKTIFINHQLKYGKVNGITRRHITSPKTSKAVRTIPMTKNVYKCLCRQKEINLALHGKNSYEVDGYKDFVFLSTTGKTLLPKNVSNQLYRTIEKINRIEQEEAEKQNREPLLLPPIRVHALRHTACTRMVERGLAVKSVQYIMGHSDVQTTLDVYTHVNMAKIKEEIWEKAV